MADAGMGARPRRALWMVGTSGVAAALLAACTDIPTDPDTPFSIAFTELPSPAVVAGDTLRDEQGAAIPLRAVAYNLAGDPIIGAPITFTVPDAGAELLNGNFLRAGAEPRTGIRVVARAAGISTPPLLLDVVPRPDSLALTSSARDTVRFSVPGSAATDISAPIQARVVHRPPVGDAVGVRSWRVRFSVVRGGVPQAPGDTSLVWLVNDRGTPSAVDTTDATGAASRRLRLSLQRPADLAALDSVVVIVSAVDERGTPLAGSPVSMTMVVRQRTNP